MKSRLAAIAISLGLAVPATAQQQKTRPYSPADGSGSALSRSMDSTLAPGARRDGDVIKSRQAVPEPLSLEDLEKQKPQVELPAEVNPEFLLQKEHGPFMVAAHTFVGPDAAKFAQLLVVELRRDYKMPAYIWFARVQPGRSNIFGVQPTAPDPNRQGDMAAPERYRMADEAVVLVGNCKTIDESQALLTQVKKIKPVCLDKLPTIYTFRRGKGLYRALLTTNPFQASQNLFPGNGTAPGMPTKNGEAFDPKVATAAFFKEVAKPKDPVVIRMNQGPNSIYKNSGKFTLQVAEFVGRTDLYMSTAKGLGDVAATASLKQSPLMTAHDDAEKLAESLNKCKSMNGLRAYVFHSRSASCVTIGAFGNKNSDRTEDISNPSVKSLYQTIPTISNELIQRGLCSLPLHPAGTLMIVPEK